jgi:hypothetical protein
MAFNSSVVEEQMQKVAFSVVAPMLMLVANSAFAMDDAFCRKYADNAMSAEQVNLSTTFAWYTPAPDSGDWLSWQAKSCGYSGPRWSNNWNDHYQWCLGASLDQVKAEESARYDDIRTCGYCDYTADRAMDDIAIERSLHCGLSGARWRNDFRSQFNVCMAHLNDPPPALASLEGDGIFVEDEARARQAEIDACRAQKLRQKLSVRPTPKPDGRVVKRLADPGSAPGVGQPSGKGNSNSGFDDPHCDRCKTRNSAVKGPDQPRGGGSAMDRLGDVNSNLGAVSGNAGGAQVGRSPAPNAGAAPPASTSTGANTGLGAAGRLMMSPTQRIDSQNSPSVIH